MIEMIKIFTYGIFIGSFEVVPGISGGTLALLLNIYERLISAIINIKTDFKKNFKFLATIVSGMGVGIYVFSHIILLLNEHYPIETNCTLAGLIVGLIPTIFKKSIGEKFSFKNFLAFILTLIFMIIINLISIINSLDTNISNGTILTSLNLMQFFKFIFVGSLSAFCLMLPGCSGTMIMLVFGIYFSVINAIHSFNFLILMPVGVGILLGLVFGAKTIDYCFTNFAKATYFGILGLIVGSAFTPFYSSINLLMKLRRQLNNEFLVHFTLSILFLLIGTIFSYYFSKKTNDLNFKRS